uniref:ATP synthase subunit a n=1 Tax=Leptynoptera sulfurea TaxID=1950150 RepID=A0A344A2H7_9HEMI|nr:ATP synthase F0 subunit 6 [Leptynoptera sulfurea]AWU48968.1 ATP synthase F0 subunit 6 [Leptynoptera sulfurea]
MMMSLFSMFDPTAMMNLQLNWLLMILSIMILPITFWILPSRNNIMVNYILTILNKEFLSLFNPNMLMKGTNILMISLFLYLLVNNIISNYPYTFCCSAHMSFSMSLALPLWSSIILFFWLNLTNTMLAHLVPDGTPFLLTPLMVVIELTSNIIRPMALAVRLTANLIAGHLLMALLGNMLHMSSWNTIIIIIAQTMFMSFEMMVAIIQSYVFSVLMTLYSSEIS